MMYILTILCLFISLLCIVYCEPENNTICVNQYLDQYKNNITDIKKFCSDTNKTCIQKCCPDQRVIYLIEAISIQCLPIRNVTHLLTNYTMDFSDIYIYNKNIKQNVNKSNKTLKDDFIFVYNRKVWLDECFWYNIDGPESNIYILEDGTLMEEYPNRYTRWNLKEMDNFCFDYMITATENMTITNVEIVYRLSIQGDDNISSATKSSLINIITLYTSSIFLILVLAVYVILPDRRNIIDYIIMGFAVSLTGASLIRASELLALMFDVITVDICVYISIIMYYLYLASFFWMNVFAYYTWKHLGNQLHRKNPIEIRKRMIKYALYAWGIPLVMAVCVKVLENVDLTHIPWFIKPHVRDGGQCFYNDEERLLYLHIPILILLLINIKLFILTAYRMWMVKRNMCRCKGLVTNNTQKKSWFRIIMSLSLVVGVSWIMEVLSPIVLPDCPIWYVGQVCNGLIGVFVFAFYVCKRQTVVMLYKRFSVNQPEWLQKWDKPTNTNSNSRTDMRRKHSQISNDSGVTDVFSSHASSITY